MMLFLTRVYGPDATTGLLLVGGVRFFTIELPWHDNKPDESCVAEGLFDLMPYMSPTHGATWCLAGDQLEGRQYCEIHSANWAEQLKGCIALGTDNQPMYDPLTGRVEPAVENSKNAVAHLIQILGEMSTGHQIMIGH